MSLRTLLQIAALLFLVNGLAPSAAQSLHCNGWTQNSQSECPPCSRGKQTRLMSQCSQPTDIHGRACGSKTCEPCTCEGTEAPRSGPIGTPSQSPPRSGGGTTSAGSAQPATSVNQGCRNLRKQMEIMNQMTDSDRARGGEQYRQECRAVLACIRNLPVDQHPGPFSC